MGFIAHKGFQSPAKGFLIGKGFLRPEKGLLGIVPFPNDIENMGYTSSQVDNWLIYIESIGTTGQLIDIRGNSPRTSASDAAVLSLTTTLDNTILEDNIAIPTGVTLTSNETSITVDWTINQAEVEGYANGTAIERSIDETTWKEIARVAYPTETYEDADPTLVEEVEYFYRLRAFVGLGTSGYTVQIGTLLNLLWILITGVWKDDAKWKDDAIWIDEL